MLKLQLNRSQMAQAGTLALSISLIATAFQGQAVAQDLIIPETYDYQLDDQDNANLNVGMEKKNYNPTDEMLREALSNIVPITPEQILDARRHNQIVEDARSKPLDPIQQNSRSLPISLKSGEASPVINVSPGWISTITFSDVTGQPWPILSVINGNPDVYNIQTTGKPGESNILTISAGSASIPTNVAITPVGANVPIMVTLQPSRSRVDYRVDALIDQRGPNAKVNYSSVSSLTNETDDSTMLSFLDGVPPAKAKSLKTTDKQVESWSFNDRLYVRTNKTLLSPAYMATQSNASGIHIYVLESTPVLLIGDRGRISKVSIKG
ncbi:DotH/IcmK family type IV secretion protein [Flexibacterium corallicola]|uniref:DotH/IcmK family type IV secretion protein n=1 Tax=Flexibacterium corallicola TaxID=3037259 RepID=UPI00286F5F34|nr:DotH/IcmK family type IV secretion protein [Pseudovibrio sp. M1P-2-3]